MTVPFLCNLKHIGGEPGKGVHAPRLFGLAAFDLIGTIVIALTLVQVYKWSTGRTVDVHMYFIAITVGLFLGIFAHRLFCVNTRLNVALFGRV